MILGRTGLEVSRVGIGGIPLTRPALADAVALVRRALDLGVNLIDTAVGYSDSEVRIGRGIRCRRSEVILATKTPARDRDEAMKHLETSLKRLGTDYLDIWQMHGLTRREDYERVMGPGGAYEAAIQAREQGKIRFVDFSGHSVDQAAEITATGAFDTVQYQLNFISREGAAKLVGVARQHNIGFMAMKPFAGGMIQDARLAIKYLLQFDNVVPVPGIEKPGQIEEIVRIVEGRHQLTAAEQQAIDEIRSQTDDRFCRQCQYCMPCPQGVDIAALMYLVRLWHLWPKERVLGWQWLTNAVAGSSNCTGCGQCEPKCPYSLPIREMIAENVRFHREAAGT